jgi:hypothetical protein
MPWETVTERYEEVREYASKSLKCTECGKRQRRSTRLTQTISPFNTNAAGQVSSREEIRAVLREQARAWEQIPVICTQCSGRVLELVHQVLAEAGLEPGYARRVDETAGGRDVFFRLPYSRPPGFGDIEVIAGFMDEALNVPAGTVKAIRAPNADAILRLVTR